MKKDLTPNIKKSKSAYNNIALSDINRDSRWFEGGEMCKNSNSGEIH